MSTRLPLRLLAGAVVCALAATSGAAHAVTRANPGAFGWLKPSHPLPGWKLALPRDGGSALWYPATLRLSPGDPWSVTVELRHPENTVVEYVNAGAKTGPEQLRGWAGFRIAHVKDENHDVRELAHASGLRFTNGGTGACVIDEYTTAHANHHYHEIACFVQGQTSQGVIVVAALVGDWPKYASELERVVAAWQVD